MYGLIDELKAKGLKVMLLTNVSETYAEILERKGHYTPFDHKVLSYQAGIIKPDPAIYKLALKQLDVMPKEAIFVDDQEQNVKAAEALGIHGIVFTDYTKFKQQLNSLL